MTAASSPSIESPVRVERDDAVAIVILNRPDRMNAINYALIDGLRNTLRELQQDDQVRAVILSGAGRHFCTGGDLKDTANGPDGETRLAVMHDCLRLMARGSKPIIAAVEGNAYGAGFSYTVAADYVVAGASAKFCAPFTGVGLVPDTGVAYTLPRRIGTGRARRMMMQGLVVQAPQAEAWGLIEQHVEDGQALATAREVAAGLARRAPLALAALRRLMGLDLDGLEESLQLEMSLQQKLLLTEDLREARTAFAEKRQPRFTGR
ncbi:MAG: enoyl-CoA hydratase/isomerase family protein [Pigmentiphaga sp.]